MLQRSTDDGQLPRSFAVERRMRDAPVVSDPRSAAAASTEIAPWRLGVRALYEAPAKRGGAWGGGVVACVKAKHRDRFLQLPRLLLEQLRRCRRLLDQRRILLSRGIHLRYRVGDLFDTQLCSDEAADISPIISAKRFTLMRIACMRKPAWFTSMPPACTFALDVSISSLISLAAVEERCASVRTSEATTVNPRPCSPARAASTAALRARILV